MKKIIPLLLRALAIVFLFFFLGAIGGCELGNLSVWCSAALAAAFLALAALSARAAAAVGDRRSRRPEGEESGDKAA